MDDWEWLFQIGILVTLWGILMGMKFGFNQVIKGLEAIERKLSELDFPTS